MRWDDDLLCVRCRHRHDYHGVEIGCMARNPAQCDCPLTMDAIYERAVRRLTAGLEVNTEREPDIEQRTAIGETEMNRDAVDSIINRAFLPRHVKAIEEILAAACLDGECKHNGECPPVSVEVCSECRTEYEDGDMVLLTPWTVAEAQGHKSSDLRARDLHQLDPAVPWTDPESRVSGSTGSEQ